VVDLLTRGILGKRLLKTKRVTIEELGADVIIRELSAGDALRLSEEGAAGKNTALIAVRSIVDDQGELLFKESEAADLAGRIPPTALNRIVSEVVKLSGLGAEEDVEKNG
jgi:hypothetical protein